MKLLSSFNKWLTNLRWKVVKVLFKDKLESQRLMILANLLDSRKSLYKYMPKSKEKYYDVEIDAFQDSKKLKVVYKKNI